MMGTAQSKSNTHNPRLALIFGHKTFVSLETRDGNESDVKGLQEILALFGFIVKVYSDKTKNTVLEIIKHYATQEDHSEYDCLLVVVLTHGEQGGVLWAKDHEFYTKDVWGPFLDCLTLQNKPKIFVFQACRGSKEESRFKINSAIKLDESNVSREMCVPVPVLPHSPDFLLIHSTVEGPLRWHPPFETSHQQVNLILKMKSMSNEKNFIGADSLLVMVIAELCETNVTTYCEKQFIKTNHSLLPINLIWGNFTASQCPWFRGKPKLFFFCDLHRTDDTRDIAVNQQTAIAESFNNTADFFWSFCYGEDSIFRELLLAFENSDEEIMQMMTTVMRRAESETQREGKTGRFSHFQSTLRLQFYLFSPPQEHQSVE
ncbi:hypothetical protein B566_EDAN011038, partial [Ephemera danica]